MAYPIKLPLEVRQDRFGKSYYITKIDSPVTIHYENGIAFIIFLSEAGEEELHICPNDSQKKQPQVYSFNRVATSEAQVLEDLDQNGRK